MLLRDLLLLPALLFALFVDRTLLPSLLLPRTCGMVVVLALSLARHDDMLLLLLLLSLSLSSLSSSQSPS